jgi:RNA polymerase sigma factor (sigma-70 family)
VEPPTREQLFEQFVPLACRLAYRDLPHHFDLAEFEDRRQVALMALWEATRPGQVVGNLRAYFRSAIKNKLTDLGRKRQRREEAEQAIKEAARPIPARDPVQCAMDNEAEAELAKAIDGLLGEDGWGLDYDKEPYIECLTGQLKRTELIAREPALPASTAYDRFRQVSAFLRDRLAEHEPEGRPAAPQEGRPVANLDEPCWQRRQQKLADLWEFVAFDCARNRLNIPETQVPGTMETTIKADWPDPGEWVPATLRNNQDTLPVVPPRWRQTPLPKPPPAERKAS